MYFDRMEMNALKFESFENPLYLKLALEGRGFAVEQFL